jgi:hypothetical protein
MEWIQSHWVGIVAGYVLFIQILKAIRDAVDSTPNEDNNAWERACTILTKLGQSLISGKRP